MARFRATQIDPGAIESACDLLFPYLQSLETPERFEPFRAWLARKTVKINPHSPCYVLAVNFGWNGTPSQELLQQVLDRPPSKRAFC